eukprot:GHRQ01002867.1.p1 GENE.GHRQ01002867.1~~GHRQ01002867.1.p1  ORF type:complete len:384 (+),score=150.50 GHRQ01002867.1:204-1355(+)
MDIDAVRDSADDALTDKHRHKQQVIESVSKLANLGIKTDSTVEHLSPQAQALARLAAEAKQHRDEDWDIRPHAMLEAAAPTRRQFDDPETSPVVVMRNPIAGRLEIGGSTELTEPVPINTDEAVAYESELFKGQLQLHIRGLSNTQQGRFSGKKRFLHLAIQGRFKRDLKASDFWSGHEFFNVSDLVPTSFVNIAYTAAARMFSSTTRVCPSTSNGQVAGFLNPVLASCQLANVSLPGQEPGLWEAQEDVRLLSNALQDKHGNPMAAEKRRRWFDVPANADSVVLSKDYVYTLHVWQHWCNISTYRLHLSSLLSIDLCQFSEGQPMQLMAKDNATGQYSINLLLWHKRLLFNEPASEQGSLRARLSSGVSSLTASWKGRLASK